MGGGRTADAGLSGLVDVGGDDHLSLMRDEEL